MKYVEANELEQMSASEANRVLIELQSRVIVLEKQMGKYVLKNTDKLYENDKVQVADDDNIYVVHANGEAVMVIEEIKE